MHVRWLFRDETTKAERRPPAKVNSIIRYYGISCRVVMAASARPAAIHGQICTATRHNKRRPLTDAAPPSSQSDRPLNPLPRTAAPLHCSTRAGRRRCTSQSFTFQIPISCRRRESSHAFQAKRSDTTQPDPSLGWSSASVCFYYYYYYYYPSGGLEARLPSTLASDVTGALCFYFTLISFPDRNPQRYVFIIILLVFGRRPLTDTTAT